MRQVAEENGLEVMDQLEQHQVGTTRPTISQTTEQEDQLSRRYVSQWTPQCTPIAPYPLPSFSGWLS